MFLVPNLVVRATNQRECCRSLQSACLHNGPQIKHAAIVKPNHQALQTNEGKNKELTKKRHVETCGDKYRLETRLTQ
jgi:hypothetical protein